MGVISISSTAEMLAAVRRARTVTFSAYFLKRGRVARGLEAAAARGTRVEVRADGHLYGGSGARMPESREVLGELRKARVSARFVHHGDADGPSLHMKAAVCDGVAYLDDCNWDRGGDSIVRDDTPSHVRAIRKAVLERDCAAAGTLALTKAAGLTAEARMLRSERCRLAEIETERLGASAVSHALRGLLAKKVHCRVLVSERAFKTSAPTQQAALSLLRAGADVRTVKASEKLAIAGGRAWIGSANATSPHRNGDEVDWSLTTSDVRTVRALGQHFAAHWRNATPIRLSPSAPRFKS